MKTYYYFNVEILASDVSSGNTVCKNEWQVTEKSLQGTKCLYKERYKYLTTLNYFYYYKQRALFCPCVTSYNIQMLRLPAACYVVMLMMLIGHCLFLNIVMETAVILPTVRQNR